MQRLLDFRKVCQHIGQFARVRFIESNRNRLHIDSDKFTDAPITDLRILLYVVFVGQKQRFAILQRCLELANALFRVF